MFLVGTVVRGGMSGGVSVVSVGGIRMSKMLSWGIWWEVIGIGPGCSCRWLFQRHGLVGYVGRDGWDVGAVVVPVGGTGRNKMLS